MNGYWILSSAFSSLTEMIVQFLLLHVVSGTQHLTAVRGSGQPCIPGMHPTWPWHMVLSADCSIQVANILLRIFTSMFIRNIGL